MAELLKLPSGRVGPYIRALHAGLDRLAPHEDFVPLREALAHLRSLDPELSHDLLLPAEVVRETGMPSYVWMERAMSERALALRNVEGVHPDQISRAEALEPSLGRRLRARMELRQHLVRWPLLPTTRLAAAVKCLTPSTEVLVSYDRIAPDGRWLRVRMTVKAPSSTRTLGPLRIDEAGKVRIGDGLRHLLTRHSLTPLLALQMQLTEAFGYPVVRLSQSWVGPFWFPGVRLPSTAPEALGQGLLLHVSTAVVAQDISASSHNDPLTPSRPSELAPRGYHTYRERRFACSEQLLPAVERWSAGQGTRNVTVVIGPRTARRL